MYVCLVCEAKRYCEADPLVRAYKYLASLFGVLQGGSLGPYRFGRRRWDREGIICKLGATAVDNVREEMIV